MSNSPDLSSVVELIKDQKYNKTPFDCYEGVYLFFSLDLSNSTAFKNIVSTWPSVFQQFRNDCRKNIEHLFKEPDDDTSSESCFIPCFEWKTQGDEIIFIFPNPSIDEFYKIPRVCYKVLLNVCKALDNQTKYSSVKLSVKGTLWGAYARDDVPTNEELDQINECKSFNLVSIDKSHKMLDFLGPDIDTGFRLSQYSCHKQMAIDAKLVWLFVYSKAQSDSPEINKNQFKMITKVHLKGVWNNRLYPIIWYLPEDHENTLLYYDDNNKAEQLNIKVNSTPDDLESIDSLEQILFDANQYYYARDFLDKLKKFSGNPIPDFTDAKKLRKSSELHLIAICINEYNEILIAKRSETKKNIPGVWDFGCTYLINNSTFEESLNQGYMFKFGTKILLQNRKNPYMTLQLHLSSGQTPEALIFFARIKKTNISQEKLNPLYYSDFKWISQKEIENHIFNEISDDDGIPYSQRGELDVVPDFYKRLEPILSRLNKTVSKKN